MKGDNRLSSQDYWNGLYAERSDAIRKRDDYIWHRFLRLFDTVFEPAPGKRLLEIGGAMSSYLEMFRSRYGLEVHAMDYSEVGCERTRVALERAGVNLGGEIMCRDFLRDTADLAGTFDYVISFGVVEHFEDPSEVMRIFARMLRPGGTVITEIPNTSGWTFDLMEWVSKDLADMHLRIDKHSMRAFHAQAGLEVLSCEYFGTFNPGMVSKAGASHFQYRFLRALSHMSRVSSKLTDMMGVYPESRLLSPYIICVARAKPI